MMRGASPLLSEPPLRRVSSFLEAPSSPSVSVRLAEPFWSGMAHLRLLVRAVQLHTLLERETVGAASDAPRRLEEVCASRPRVAEALEELCNEAALLGPDQTSPMPLLDETGLSAMCPLVAHYLGDPDKVYRSDAVPAVREYLDHVASLNQLLTIASQLKADVAGGRHKYAAHKIALLYHAINNSKLAREHLRKRIEEHFEDVKESTEANESPSLPKELADWIVGVCDEASNLVREVPPSMRAKLAPTSRYLHSMR